MSILHSAGIFTIETVGNVFHSDSFVFFFLQQKTAFIKNIEKLSFWADENQKLHFAKQELISQINNLDISISGKGYLTVNRQFMAGVS